MLVLTRKLGESISIDGEIRIVIVQIKGRQVRLGIQAPHETKIVREEVVQRISDENRTAVKAELTPTKKVAKPTLAS